MSAAIAGAEQKTEMLDLLRNRLLFPEACPLAADRGESGCLEPDQVRHFADQPRRRAQAVDHLVLGHILPSPLGNAVEWREPQTVATLDGLGLIAAIVGHGAAYGTQGNRRSRDLESWIAALEETKAT